MYEVLRKLMFPLDEFENLIPKDGKILDVGCGHGTLSRYLLQKSEKRQIKGIDPSGEKIEIARKLGKGFKDLSFEKKYVEEITEKFDCIIISDVLYLLPDNRKVELLAKCRQILKNDGLLVVKTDSHEPRWLFSIIRLQEFIMVNLIKFTHSDYGGFYSLSRRGYAKVIEKAGFSILKTRTFKSTIPYRHIAYVAEVEK